MSSAKTKYDRVTRALHAALATGVTVELILQAVMRVPAGVGLGVDDWHREAFELHAHFGPTVAVLCALHWLWICLPFSRPGIAYLFPWARGERRAVLKQELTALLWGKLPPREGLSPLLGSVHGLGFMAVTGSVVGGVVSYLGYFTPVSIPGRVLHWTAWEQVIMSGFVWTFVAGHVSMALWHWLEDRGLRGRMVPHPARSE
ncbi:MAG: cytochrome b/b6 domain-containing protein [Bacillota bacterium]